MVKCKCITTHGIQCSFDAKKDGMCTRHFNLGFCKTTVDVNTVCGAQKLKGGLCQTKVSKLGDHCRWHQQKPQPASPKKSSPPPKQPSPQSVSPTPQKPIQYDSYSSLPLTIDPLKDISPGKAKDYSLETSDYSIFETIGRRPTQEDRFFIYNDDNIGVYAIFDGHGGSEVSQMAKVFLEQQDLSKLNQPSLKDKGEQLFDLTKRLVYKTYYEESGSCSLITVVYKKNREMLVSNMGDSRCYLWNHAHYHRMISRDHKPLDPIENEIIRKMGASIVFGRLVSMNGTNALSVSRALGDKDFPLIREPEITHSFLGSNAQILMSCDGLWESGRNQPNSAIEKQMFDALAERDVSAKELAKMALINGSKDNITIIKIQIKKWLNALCSTKN